MERWIKEQMRAVFPARWYAFLYIHYARVFARERLNSRTYSYAGFTKRGLHTFTLDSVSFPIMLDPKNGGVDYEIAADGAYEPDMLRVIRDLLGPESVFLDIGANIGQHSLYASYWCKHVYAFEPITRLYDQFRESIRANDRLNISVYNYALGTVRETIAIFGTSQNMGASSIVVPSNKHKIQDIRVLKFDDVASEIGIERVEVVKIDVEGYELKVLLGAERFIRQHMPTIIFEYSPRLYREFDESVSREILETLISWGYQLFDIGDGSYKKEVHSIESLIKVEQTNILCSAKKHAR